MDRYEGRPSDGQISGERERQTDRQTDILIYRQGEREGGGGYCIAACLSIRLVV